jgi:OPA family glycerol-3-phosphate transporter-like MFS transporter
MGAAISMYGIAAISDTLGWNATVLSWVAIALVGAVFCALALGRYSTFMNDN